MERAGLRDDELKEMAELEAAFKELTLEADSLTEWRAKFINDVEWSYERYTGLTRKVKLITGALLSNLETWALTQEETDRAVALLDAFQTLELSWGNLIKVAGLLTDQLRLAGQVDKFYVAVIKNTLKSTIAFTERKGQND